MNQDKIPERWPPFDKLRANGKSAVMPPAFAGAGMTAY